MLCSLCTAGTYSTGSGQIYFAERVRSFLIKMGVVREGERMIWFVLRFRELVTEFEIVFSETVS